MARKPNLIVILIDDLRFDETSASNVERDVASHRLDNYHLALQALGHETMYECKT